ncbi:helix-turn-helix domain-containing protein [Halovulum sp. GXIMD14794]
MTHKESIAGMLARAIDYSGLTQAEISRRAGLGRPNFLSMMKSGEARVPIERIPAIASACGVEPIPLLRAAMREYHPEVWSVLLEHFSHPLTRTEEAILEAYDEAGEGRDLRMNPALYLACELMFREMFEAHGG